MFEGDAKDLLVLNGSGSVGSIHLDDVVGALALLTENLQCLVGKAGSNDPVAHLTLDNQGRCLIADVGESYEITIARHTVGTAGTGIGAGHWRGIKSGNVINKVYLLQRVAQGESHGSTGGRNMLERCCSRQPRSLLELADQLPGVQCIQEINITWTAIQHFDGEFATVVHKDSRWFLVGVATVL